MALSWLGGILALLDPFQRVANYLRGVKESREVREELKKALASLQGFIIAVKNSQKSGRALVAKIDSLEAMVRVPDLEELMTLSVSFNTSYEGVLNDICNFGSDCHDLISGNYEAFMGKVKARQPEVYDFLNSFGRNYNPKTGTIDLSFLPMLLKIYGQKVGWRDDGEATKAVEEAKMKLERISLIAKGMKGRHLPLRNRSLVIGYVHSVQRLARAAKRHTANKQAAIELRKGAPAWYGELIDFMQRAGRELPSGSGRELR